MSEVLTPVMLHSKEARLFEAFPRLYANRNRKNSPMERGLLVGNGWHDLIWDLSYGLEPLVRSSEETVGSGMGAPVPRAIQVGERSGELVFVMGPRELVTDAMYELIDVAENRAIITCEICGAHGRYKLRAGQTQTLCITHETDTRR